MDCVQPELSLLHRDATRDVIPWCQAHGTGVIIYSPLGSGLLAGTGDKATLEAMSSEDRRCHSADQILQLTERLRMVAHRAGTGLSTLAIAWTLATDGVTGAICGARRPGHVQEWIAAADLVLDQAILAEIESIVRAT